MAKERKLPIMELFGPTIQGEGIMAGTITHFLRTGGCGLRCTWCDTLFAVEPKQIRAGRQMMTTAEILSAISSLPPAPYVTFTGGDPCLHKGLGDMIHTLNAGGMLVAVETQGELFPEWLSTVDVVTFSPKPPSSGNPVDFHDLKDWIIDHSATGRRPFKVCIKIVIFDDKDFQYALNVYSHIPMSLYDAFYFTAGTPMFVGEKDPDDPLGVHEKAQRKIAGVLSNQQTIASLMLQHTSMVKFNSKTHLGCQQHVLLWPDKEKGV